MQIYIYYVLLNGCKLIYVVHMFDCLNKYIIFIADNKKDLAMNIYWFVSVCTIQQLEATLNVNETMIEENTFPHTKQLNCKPGYRTSGQTDNNVMQTSTQCNSDGQWTNVIACEAKGNLV